MANGAYVEPEYKRDMSYITDRIVTADTAADLQADPAAAFADPESSHLWPVAAGRYRLVAARACPWANRTIIVRRLLGLEDAISLGMPGPTHDADSWTFDLDPGGLDPVLRIPRLKDAYEARQRGYPRGITVPALVEVASGKVVTNDFPQITVDCSTQWREFHRTGAPDLLPEESAAEMLEINDRVFRDVNNGVYRCGFSGSQAAYESAYQRLFAALDWLEELLGERRYLLGDHITEADVRLFTTLVRFDPVYHGHFKCNRQKLSEFDNLWAYARDLFQTPGFGDTIDFVQIKRHYYIVHTDINPTGIVPAGPDLSNWGEPHGRQALGGSPFAPGASAPGPVPEGERVDPAHNPFIDPATGLVSL